jgi:hypothetical protein
MAEFLNSTMLEGVVVRVAERIRDRAIVLAPIGTVLEGDTHPGEYISSFRVIHHRWGGIHYDRVEAVVSNHAEDAVYVEFGHYGREPYHVLRRAAEGVTL